MSNVITFTAAPLVFGPICPQPRSQERFSHGRVPSAEPSPGSASRCPARGKVMEASRKSYLVSELPREAYDPAHHGCPLPPLPSTPQGARGRL